MTERTVKLLEKTGIILAVYLSMKYLLPVVAPFFVALLLARLVYPLAARLEKKLPLRKGTITLFLLLAGAAAVLAAGWYLGTQLLAQIRSVVAKLPYYREQASEMAMGCCRMAERTLGVDGDAAYVFLAANMERAQVYVKDHTVPGLVKNSMAWALGALKVVGGAFLIFVAVLLIVKDYDEIRTKLENYRYWQKLKRIFGRLWSLGGAYLKAQLIIMLTVIVLCVIGLWLTGSSYALLLGILIGILDALPFVGTGAVFVPWSLICLLRADFIHAAAYFTIFILASAVREYLEPRLLGERMGVYPIVIALVVYAGVCLYGAVGVLLGPLSLLIILECIRELT